MNQIESAQLLNAVIQSNEGRLNTISNREASLPRTEGKWSPKEIIGHLVDSAINNYVRFANAEDTDELWYNGYQQEEWVIRGKYNEEAWSDLVLLWSKLNLQLSRLVEGIPEIIYLRNRSKHNLDKIAWKSIPKTEVTSLAYFVRDYIGHIEHHLGQIWSNYENVGKDYSN